MSLRCRSRSRQWLWRPHRCSNQSRQNLRWFPNHRRHEPRLLLLAIYSTVIGMVTEVEVLRALGEEPSARSLVRRRTDALQLLRSALLNEQAD